MTARKEKGRWPEFSDATGIDAKYAEEQAEADRQLKDATAGPQTVQGLPVMVGDTAMKNPHGAFAMPSPVAGARSTRPARRPRDPEGQQGGYVRCGGPEQHVPVGGVRTPQGEDPQG